MPTTSPLSNSPTTSTTPIASRLFDAGLERPAGAGVDDVMAPRPRRQADPALAGPLGLAPGQEEGADRLAGEDPG